jgi:hypothetical protein
MRTIPFGSIVVVLALALTGGCGSDKPSTAGDRAKGMKSQANQQGTEHDGLLCDASTEGEGFCVDDWTIVFCADGYWWALDCSALGAVCYEDAYIVDCYAY